MSLNLFFSGTAVLLCTALSLGLVIRGRRSASNLFFSAGMLMLAAESIFQGISLAASAAGQIEQWQSLTFVTKPLLVAIWFCFSLTYSRGAYSRSWKTALILVGLLCPFAAAIWFRETLVRALPYSKTDPTWWLHFGAPGKVLNLILLIGIVLILMNLERTLRSAVGTVRWRIKFIILGLGVIFGVRIYTRSQDMLFSGHQLALASIETGAVILGCLLIATGFLRRGFSEIDLYPSRAVLHASLTVMLVGGYLLIVGLLAQVAGQLGGARNFQLQAFLLLIGLVVLAILLLSEKTRQRVRVFVSRNFKRPQHDVRRVWTQFTAGMAGAKDPLSLCAVVSRLLSETFSALSVSIWLADSQGERLLLAASTLGTPAAGSEMESKLAGPSLDRLEKLTHPFDLDTAKGEEAVELRKISGGQFLHGGHRICVPLRSTERWLGLALLADRVSGTPYAVEELDLLECIGEQVAASLLNFQLAAEMAKGRELEALQNVSAFFVHDLKNAASTLSLMLTNLPVHFGDPAFREDALRGIARTVERIKQLIARATELQHGFTLRSAEVDLNTLLNEAIEQMDRREGVRWVKNLRPMPKLIGDQQHLHSVVTNLLINAGEAVGQSGMVSVETNLKDNWAELLVTDDGCGMTRDFLHQSLFQPFRSTKQKGLGIGMFQSKMIIEAHGGKISVTSEPESGTTFRVLLPLKP
jgi:putative PEP-CTERM system histidine kinase